MTRAMSSDAASAGPADAGGSHGTATASLAEAASPGRADAEGSHTMTREPSLDAATAATAATATAAPAEAADADGLGDVAVDDPADADAPGHGQPGEWVRVCRLDQLTPDRGRAALVGGQQVAVFRMSAPLSDPPSGSDGEPSPSKHVYAIGNRDPFSGAHVLSRGIVGDKGGVPKVASPVYKQSFDLRTGTCLDDPEVTVPVYRVRVEDGWVLVEVPGGSP